MMVSGAEVNVRGHMTGSALLVVYPVKAVGVPQRWCVLRVISPSGQEELEGVEQCRVWGDGTEALEAGTLSRESGKNQRLMTWKRNCLKSHGPWEETGTGVQYLHSRSMR